MSSGSVHAYPEASFVATSAITSAYRAVKKDTATNKIVIASAVTDYVIGIAQSLTTQANEPVTVMTDGYSLAVAGAGGWSRGDFLTPATGGALIATTTATNLVCAVAEDAVAAGERGEVRLINPVEYSVLNGA